MRTERHDEVKELGEAKWFDRGRVFDKVKGYGEAKELAKAKGLGIRGLFRIAIVIVSVAAFLTLVTISYSNITADEGKRAEASMRSEVNYLCLQLESLSDRTDAFARFASLAEEERQELEAQDPEGYRLLTDPIGDILSGYTLAETGTVVIIVGNTVAASDDGRVPVGSDTKGLLGEEVCDAIGASLESGEMQTISYGGVFDQPGGEGAYGDDDDEACLIAGKQRDFIVAIIEPMSMVYRDRIAVIGREAVVGFVILFVVSLIVDRLLSLLVARRIDKTNEALESIVSGNLETRVEGEGTREFKSLASGINITVEALQGWIDEAETRMDSELAAGRAIQQSALPRTFPAYPDISRFDVFAIMDAAKEVGGDFYDFFVLGGSGPDSGKLAFLVADVSGKGIPAALFMMKAAAKVRGELQSGSDLSRAVENVNAELLDGNDTCMFVTMWVGVLDYGTGHVDYVNAGHNPPLHWGEGTGWHWLKDRSGLPLGLIDGGSYDTYSLDCRSGDKLLLYTDGVTEAMSKDGELYGEDRLEAVANAKPDDHPEALVKAVRSDVASFAQDAEQSDDITILVLEAR